MQGHDIAFRSFSGDSFGSFSGDSFANNNLMLIVRQAGVIFISIYLVVFFLMPAKS